MWEISENTKKEMHLRQCKQIFMTHCFCIISQWTYFFYPWGVIIWICFSFPNWSPTPHYPLSKIKIQTNDRKWFHVLPKQVLICLFLLLFRFYDPAFVVLWMSNRTNQRKRRWHYNKGLDQRKGILVKRGYFHHFPTSNDPFIIRVGGTKMILS